MTRVTENTARLLLAVIVGLAMLSSSPATVEADDNPVDLELGGEGATSWDIGNIQPGDSGTKIVELRNAGSKDGFVTIWISDIVSSEGTNPESETGDISEPGELNNYLLFNLSCSRLSTNLSLPTTIDNLPQSASDPNYIKVSPLNAGDTVNLDWEWELPPQTANDVQGDSLSFTINYCLEEFPSPPPTGGNGAGTAYVTLRINILGKVTTVRVSHAGKLLDSCVASDADHNLQLEFDKSTKIVCANNKPPRRIELRLAHSPPLPPGDTVIISPIYQFNAYLYQYSSNPSPLTISPPAKLLLAYDPNELPENTSSMVIAYYDDEQGWVELEPAFDGVGMDGMATAGISHFTYFAILANLSPPPAFECSSLSISPTEIYIGEKVNITVLIANTGGQSGNYEVLLKINGVVSATTEVTIDAGASKSVTFTTSKNNAGTYSVDVGGLSSSFTVKQEPVPPPPPAEPEPAKPINWWLIGGILGGIALVVFVVFRVLFRFER